MPSWKDDANDLINYAKGGEPILPPYPHGYLGSFGKKEEQPMYDQPGDASYKAKHAHNRSATVTPLQPKAEPTLQDEILQMLDELAADIRAGEVSPCYLILGYGDETTLPSGDTATNFVWDANGVNRFELIGHLTTYGTKLANEEGE